MDFKQFYKTINFDIDNEIRTVYQATQGDTKSRGLLVDLIVGGVKTPVTTETMRFFALKPDGTRVMTAGVKEGTGFRIDFTNQTFAVPGVLLCTLVLYGTNGEKIADKKFKMTVDTSLEDGAIVSEDERGVLDRAFDLASDIVPRLEALDVPLLENLEQEVTEIKGALKHIKLESWEDVQKAVRDGSHKSIVSVGDSFVAKYAGVDYFWDVIGINHDIPADSNYTNSLTIQARDCLMNCVFDAPEPTNPDANRAQYGSNNYLESNIRQWLNDNNATFNFVAQTPYDVKPTVAPYTGAGFLHNLDPELRGVIGPVKKQVAKNTVTDDGGQDTFEDTVFLLSNIEAYGGAEGDTTGEKPYEYYSVLAPAATSAELAGRIKYLSGASRHWWFRSPSVGHSQIPRSVYPTGYIYNGYAYNAYGLAPACTIY